MLHVTFTGSGAGILNRALRNSGLKQNISALFDDLSVGPVDPPDPDDRLRWMQANLRPRAGSDRDWLPDDTKSFWSDALRAEACTVWMTRRVASEYCGFLEWVRRAGDRPYKVVDLTDARLGGGREGRPLISLALVNHESVDFGALLDGAEPLSDPSRKEYRRIWETLRRENAPLRRIEWPHIVSAPIEYFDELLLSFVGDDWQHVISVAVNASNLTWDHIPIDIDVLTSRLFALAQARRIEARGAFDRWERCQVRLPGQNRPRRLRPAG